jgi:hypothetical protein
MGERGLLANQQIRVRTSHPFLFDEHHINFDNGIFVIALLRAV